LGLLSRRPAVSHCGLLRRALSPLHTGGYPIVGVHFGEERDRWRNCPATPPVSADDGPWGVTAMTTIVPVGAVGTTKGRRGWWGCDD
jgi:hypothetical protein